MGQIVLILDMDSQCNMSLYGMQEKKLEEIWRDEDYVIDNGFDSAEQEMEKDDFKNLFNPNNNLLTLVSFVPLPTLRSLLPVNF